MRRLLAMGCVAILIGCSTTSGDIPRNTSIVPKGALRVFPRYSIAFADIVLIAGVAAAVYSITDPTLPAWEITEIRLPDHRVQYNLRMQYLHLGGDGEARYVLARRAEALAQEEGLAGYQIQRFEEAVDSRIWLPRRTAYAEVKLLAAS